MYSLRPLLSKKIKRDNRSKVHQLDLHYALSALACPFKDHLASLLFDTISMAREGEEDSLQFTASNITILEVVMEKRMR